MRSDRSRGTRSARRSASSSPPGARASPPSRPGSRRTAVIAAGFPACGARRSRSSPGSRRSTTSVSSAATRPASPRASSTGSPTRCELDEAERAHLLDLLRTAGTPDAHSSPTVADCPAGPPHHPAAHRLDARDPAVVLNGRLDVIAANALGRALFHPVVRRPGRHAQQRPVRVPRPAGHDVLPGVGQGRERHRRDPARRGRPGPPDRELSDLVGQLSTRSEDFRVRWAAHDVRIHNTSVKLLHHPSSATSTCPSSRSPRCRLEHGACRLHPRTGLRRPGRPGAAGQLGRQRPGRRAIARGATGERPASPSDAGDRLTSDH